MPFAILTVPGVSGGVSTEYSFWGGYRFTVDGQRVKPHGFPRNRLTFPGTSGPVDAKVKGGLFRAHPILVVGGSEYSTGPPTPAALQAVALLPLLALLLVQGGLGFLVAFGGMAVNMGIVRGSYSDRSKVGLMVGTLIAAIVVDVVILVAVTSVGGS